MQDGNYGVLVAGDLGNDVDTSNNQPSSEVGETTVLLQKLCARCEWDVFVRTRGDDALLEKNSPADVPQETACGRQ